jgi:hypothetical protein
MRASHAMQPNGLALLRGNVPIRALLAQLGAFVTPEFAVAALGFFPNRSDLPSRHFHAPSAPLCESR